jgi:hypothetical protein
VAVSRAAKSVVSQAFRTRTARAAYAYLEAIAAMAVTAVGENPVLAPVKFDMVINLETASA